MNNFNMGVAWSQGFAFIKNNLVLCLIMAAIGVIIPQAMQMLLFGGDMAALMNPRGVSGVGGLAALGSMGITFFLISLVGMVIQYAAMFGAWRGGLDNDVPVMTALVYGLIAGVTSLIALFIVGFAAILPLALIIGGTAGAFVGAGSGSMPGAGTIAFAGLAVLLWSLFMVWLTGRLIASGPWMADNAVYNPFTGLANAWRMSSQGQWAIFGYLLLLFVVYIMFAGIIGAVTGFSAMSAVMGGNPDPASIGQFSIIMSVAGIIISIPLTLIGYAIPAGIYLSLRQSNTEAIFG